MIRERGHYTFEKMFGFLLIHHIAAKIPCLLLCEMCRPDRRSSCPPLLWRSGGPDGLTPLHF